MRYGLAIGALALAVAGCGGAESGKAQTRAQIGAQIGAKTSSASFEPPAAASLPTPTSSQQCDAASLAYLVGRPKTEIPVPVDTSHRRVACTTCMAAADYQPNRTDIVFDARTGLVTSVKCG